MLIELLGKLPLKCPANSAHLYDVASVDIVVILSSVVVVVRSNVEGDQLTTPLRMMRQRKVGVNLYTSYSNVRLQCLQIKFDARSGHSKDFKWNPLLRLIISQH